MEPRGRTQDGNGDENRDEDDSNSGDGNGDENGDEDDSNSGDRNGDGNKDGIGEGVGEAKTRKKPHKNFRRNQALSFRTRRHFCRQGVVLAGTRQLRSQDSVPVHAHRAEGVTGSEGREGTNGGWDGIGVGGGIVDVNRDGDGD